MRAMTVAFSEPLRTRARSGGVDQFVYLHDVSFRQYEAMLEMRGEHSVPRITYLEGVIELMNPSRQHEDDKKTFARLFEAWADEAGVDVEGIGSWTLKDEGEERGAEPDECYTVGRVPESDDDRPDLAIEVIWTSGGINKLEVYRKLRVREVWFYERGSLRFYGLVGDTYEPLPHSEVVAGLDVALLLRCMAEPTQSAAVRALRAAMRAK